ncbi:MAG: DciA family protein [Planctomycetia bacterium]|nr:DciA family protein [Planctomycetia bacterium]
MSKDPNVPKKPKRFYPLGVRYLEEQKPRPIRVTHFSAIMPQIMAKYGGGRKIGVERFQKVWQEIQDDLFDSLDDQAAYTNHLRLESFRNKTVRIEVEGNTLLQEISFYKNAILQQFQQKLPEENIRFIKFVRK